MIPVIKADRRYVRRRMTAAIHDRLFYGNGIISERFQDGVRIYLNPWRTAYLQFVVTPTGTVIADTSDPLFGISGQHEVNPGWTARDLQEMADAIISLYR